MSEHTLDLSADNVFQADLDVDSARDLTASLADLGYDDLSSELDEAQGKVFGASQDQVSYLVITIIPAPKEAA